MPPKKKDQLPKADLRSEITAFRLLVWTYADERVRAANVGGDLAPQAATSTVLGRLIDGDIGSARGTINGLLDPHQDAWEVNGLVLAWFDQNSTQYTYLASYLEKRLPPPHPSTLEPLRRIPRLRANGKPYYRYDASRHVIGMVEDEVGHDANQIAYAGLIYDLFIGLLDVLSTAKLHKWKVVGRGLTVCAESLTKDGRV